MTGEAVDITTLDDPVFSQKMVGDGIAIVPTDGDVVSPVDGKVIQLFETGHAIGIQVDDVELLIHIGMDTVELKGEGFTKIVQEGDEVKAGDLLIKADLEKIKSLGKPVETPVVITELSGKTMTKTLGPVTKGKTVILTIK